MNRVTKLGKEYRKTMDPEILHCWALEASHSLKELGKLLDKWNDTLEATTNNPSIVMRAVVKEILDKAFPGENDEKFGGTFL